MKLSNTVVLADTPDRIWSALLDPEVLQQCLPGCTSLDQVEDQTYIATLKTQIGPLKTTFKGKVTLSDPTPPPHDPATITITGEGKSPAGIVRGEAVVQLRTAEDKTELSYDANATIGGKIAQLGGRVVDAVAQKMAKEFFATFAETISPAPPSGDTD